MKNKLICMILLVSIFSSFSVNLFAEDTSPVPYEQNEFPQALKDLRRFEIISLGSMPFIMLDSTIAYSAYKSLKSEEGEGMNFLGKNSFTYEESKKLILTSLGISVTIGLTDYIVRVIKRNNKSKKLRQKNSTESIKIYTTEKETFENFDDFIESNVQNQQTIEELEDSFQEDNEDVFEVEE